MEQQDLFREWAGAVFPLSVLSFNRSSLCGGVGIGIARMYRSLRRPVLLVPIRGGAGKGDVKLEDSKSSSSSYSSTRSSIV